MILINVREEHGLFYWNASRDGVLMIASSRGFMSAPAAAFNAGQETPGMFRLIGAVEDVKLEVD